MSWLALEAHCSFGEFTLTLTVWDEDEQTATEKARAVQQVVDGVGLVSEIEDFNAVQAWMGSLPGHAYSDVRRPLMSSLNVCDLVPLSAVWSGPPQCAQLNGPPLLVTRTKGSTPFRLSLHQGDVVGIAIGSFSIRYAAGNIASSFMWGRYLQLYHHMSGEFRTAKIQRSSVGRM